MDAVGPAFVSRVMSVLVRHYFLEKGPSILDTAGAAAAGVHHRLKSWKPNRLVPDRDKKIS